MSLIISCLLACFYQEFRECGQRKTDAVKRHLKYCRTTTDYTRLLKDPDIDIIVIGTKQDTHAKLIVEALDAGKWVFCEKSMAETDEETAAVLAAEQRNPGKLAIGFNRRFAPAYLKVRDLMKNVPRPWYINYRLMFPVPGKSQPGDYYSTQPRMLYEWCHVLDYVSFLMGEKTCKVYMTGDRYSNNSCILSYADGSPISFACGSLGSVCMCSKEYMEVFGKDVVITVSEFIDMRVRGIPGEFDQIYPPHMNERAEEVLKYGYDFYETYKGVEMMQYVKTYKDLYNIDLEYVRRPYSSALNPDNMKFELQNPDLWSFQPDKGWIESFEHFAKAFLEGKEPLNADGSAGKLTTDLALKLLESREKGQALDF